MSNLIKLRLSLSGSSFLLTQRLSALLRCLTRREDCPFDLPLGSQGLKGRDWPPLWTAAGPHPDGPRIKLNLFAEPLLILEPLPGMAAKNKCLAHSNKTRTEGEATKERETGRISDVLLNEFRR